MPDKRGATIHVTGIVQGVGFRPFIYNLAIHYELGGWVRNSSAGVVIKIDGTQENIDAFVHAVKAELPNLARMDSFEISFEPPNQFTRFEIIESETVEGAFQPIPPDVSICDDCLNELFNPKDRRYRYPFINCTNCGPRFTIITDIPYDRRNTTMALFKMCPECGAEYQNPGDRRFHAQPVACPVCGPKVWLERKGEGKISLEGDIAFFEAQKMLRGGNILAVKGLGGFHLACDATNPASVAELRQRKMRVDKPFALMMSDMATIEKNCIVTPSDRDLIESHQRPIVLLQKRPESKIAEDVAPKQETLGVMLPYTPLHILLFNGKNQPPTALVMTSGNLSEEPIATGNDEARERLSPLADAFLMHNRDIHTRCDDSVARIFKEKKIFLRRSRGYAPDTIRLPFDVPPILATGPELKNTFCLTRENYAFISHHIGDMENYETFHSFEDGITQFENLFRIRPQAMAYDLHPNYLATRYALDRADRENLPAVGVQHHHAHIAACMADNGLNGTRAVIGVAFDGTGYGQDGAIWGGEFFVADYANCERKLHIKYFPLPGGDAAIKHPARTALALLWSCRLEWDEDLAPVREMSYEERNIMHTQLEHGLNSSQTSSMGRLFDAAAALAGVRQKVNYEAQAAIEFEAALEKTESSAYEFEIHEDVVDARPVIMAMLADMRRGTAVSIISARFHNGVSNMVRRVCKVIRSETGLKEIALSGGVWQNMALLDQSVRGLEEDGFEVYIHRQTPTNDGGISLGQALVGAVKIKDNEM